MEVLATKESSAHIYISPTESQVSLSQRPQVAFSLSQSPSGMLCALATDHVFILRPIISDQSLGFELASEKLKIEQNSVTASKLIGYISGRRWKQKSVSEVDFQPSQSMYQMELNIQIGKLSHKENDLSGKKLFITRCCWSPLGWDSAGGSLLAILTSLDTLLVYSSSAGESIGFKQLYFINQLLYETAMTVEDLEEQCPEILWTESFHTMNAKMNRFCVASAEWSPTFRPTIGLPYLFLSCGMKDGRLLLWKLNFSENDSGLSLKMKYQNQFNADSFTWINILSWSDTIKEKSAYLMMGFTDGTISVVHFDINSYQLSVSVIYAVEDDASVLAVSWGTIAEETSLFLIKGSYLFMFSLSVDAKIKTMNSSFVLADISHSFPITSLCKMLSNILVVGFRDGRFSLFEYGNSKLTELERESREFSEFIRAYLERLTRFNFEILGLVSSPNSFFVTVLCVGSLIGRGRPSKIEISQTNKLFFIPLLEFPFVYKRLNAYLSKYLDWDLIKLKLASSQLTSNPYIISTLPDRVRLKLEYISDFISGRSTHIHSIFQLLKRNLISTQAAIDAIDSEFQSDLMRSILDLNEDNIKGIAGELELIYLCEICDSRLELEENLLYFHCSNQHKIDRCLYTLQPLHLGEEILRCGLCKQKVRMSAVRDLFVNTTRIVCPLCDGFLMS